MSEQALELQTTTPIAVERRPPSVADMLQAVVEKGVTGENVAALEKLVTLYEHMEQKEAEKKFNSAFVALQSEMPAIVATTVIPNRGKYEKFEDVMKVVGPLLAKHGFSVSFSMNFTDNRIVETCQLKHVGGHSQSNSFAVRVGKADTETQADCKAATTAKRNALLNALNIVIRQDCLTEENDASIEGDPTAFVSPEQASELEARVKATNSNIPAFLKFAGATKFSEIAASKYGELDAMLTRKEKTK